MDELYSEIEMWNHLLHTQWENKWQNNKALNSIIKYHTLQLIRGASWLFGKSNSKVQNQGFTKSWLECAQSQVICVRKQVDRKKTSKDQSI